MGQSPFKNVQDINKLNQEQRVQYGKRKCLSLSDALYGELSAAFQFDASQKSDFPVSLTELKLGAQAHYQLMADLKTKIGSAKSFAVKKKTAIVPSPWPWPSFA